MQEKETAKKEGKKDFRPIFEKCKQAEALTKDKVPKQLVIFPLLLCYFGESENDLYKIIDVSNVLLL